MKSLEIINAILKCDTRGFVDANILKQIKPDLEVLEIIVDKSVDFTCLEMSANFITYRCMVGSTRLNNKEYDKLKQWLEENE